MKAKTKYPYRFIIEDTFTGEIVYLNTKTCPKIRKIETDNPMFELIYFDIFEDDFEFLNKSHRPLTPFNTQYDSSFFLIDDNWKAWKLEKDYLGKALPKVPVKMLVCQNDKHYSPLQITYDF